MLVKFTSEDPVFEQAIQILKIRYRTTATSKAVKRSVYDSAKMNVEIEMLRAHNESMESEIDRLRSLLETFRTTKLDTKWRYKR